MPVIGVRLLSNKAKKNLNPVPSHTHTQRHISTFEMTTTTTTKRTSNTKRTIASDRCRVCHVRKATNSNVLGMTFHSGGKKWRRHGMLGRIVLQLMIYIGHERANHTHMEKMASKSDIKESYESRDVHLNTNKYHLV